MLAEYESFNKQVVKAVMNGSMERKVYWMSSGIISLHKRIKFHEDKIEMATDRDIILELRGRLQSYQRQLKEFVFEDSKQNYFTRIQMIFDPLKRPEVLYHKKLYFFPSEREVGITSVDVKFAINFSDRKRVKWTVEKIFPQSLSKFGNSTKSLYSFECKDLNKIPNILFTLPSLITEDCMASDLDNFPVYTYDFRKE